MGYGPGKGSCIFAQKQQNPSVQRKPAYTLQLLSPYPDQNVQYPCKRFFKAGKAGHEQGYYFLFFLSNPQCGSFSVSQEMHSGTSTHTLSLTSAGGHSCAGQDSESSAFFKDPTRIEPRRGPKQ
jgi:hypothetical protein